VAAAWVHDEPVELLIGPGHEFAAEDAVSPAGLAGHRIWMPDLTPGTEWAAYYGEFAAAFGLSLDTAGPGSGTEPLLDTLAGTPGVATLVGEGTRFVWPADYGLRRVALRGPVPVYPHALIWHRDNPHPDLAALRAHLAAARPAPSAVPVWTPAGAAPAPGRPLAGTHVPSRDV
jgi:hypothetical protein